MINVLLLISESWNDIKYPNNNLTNWFKGFDELNIRTISGGSYIQINDCCSHYFQVSDKDMAISLLSFKKAGKIVNGTSPVGNEKKSFVSKRSNKLRKPFFRFVRNILWRFGKYNKKELKAFIDVFNPDVVFSVRLGGVKMCRMESVVRSYTNVPMIAFTGDNEYGNDIKFHSFFEKLNYKWSRRWLDKLIPTYSLYYSMSQDQMAFYMNKFGVKTKFLVKCGDFNDVQPHNKVNHIINIIYAGKLYANRWKTLALLVRVMNDINSSETKVILNIYTNDSLSYEQSTLLNVNNISCVHQAITPAELKKKYDACDIVLHVESLDEEESQYTKYSFSTKLVDCFSSGCAVLAVCNKNQSGLKYLKEHDIGFTASDEDELRSILNKLVKNPDLIISYSRKVIEFGKDNLQRENVQKEMLTDFKSICQK